MQELPQQSHKMSAPSRWIITGGVGFLGTNFLKNSRPEDGEIVVLDRSAPRWKVVQPWIRYVEQDVREVDAYRNEIVEGSVVLHLASSSYPGKAEKVIESDIQDNVLGTIRLAQACADQGVRSLLFLSSGGAIYGNQTTIPIREDANPMPISAYGAMKLTIEHYLRIIHHLRGLPVASLRVANPFGPWHSGVGQGALNVFLNQVLRNETIEIWGEGKKVRDYIPIEDAMDAIRRVGCGFTKGFELFNVGTGVGRSLNDILKHIEQVTGTMPDVRFMPSRNIDVDENAIDCTKIKQWYGWESKTPFLEALTRTWEWVRTQH